MRLYFCFGGASGDCHHAVSGFERGVKIVCVDIAYRDLSVSDEACAERWCRLYSSDSYERIAGVLYLGEEPRVYGDERQACVVDSVG